DPLVRASIGGSELEAPCRDPTVERQQINAGRQPLASGDDLVAGGSPRCRGGEPLRRMSLTPQIVIPTRRQSVCQCPPLDSYSCERRMVDKCRLVEPIRASGFSRADQGGRREC